MLALTIIINYTFYIYITTYYDTIFVIINFLQDQVQAIKEICKISPAGTVNRQNA
jgi:hypothetical protein